MSNNQLAKPDRLDRIERALEQAAFTSQTVNDQLGLITTELRANKTQMSEMRKDISGLKEIVETNHNEFVEYKEIEKAKLKEVNSSQMKDFQDAIEARCRYLMDHYNLPEFIYGQSVIGKLKSKCWNDAKRKSRMLNKAGCKTLDRDYEEVMQFIRMYEPDMGAVGYINYLIERHEKKERSKTEGVA